jgi:N-acetylmuramoyl-L-alanine amidase
MHKPVIILDPGHGGWTSFFYDLDNGVRLDHTWDEVAHLGPSEKVYFSSGEARRWKSGELAVEPRFYFERNGRKITYGDPGDVSPLDPRICEKDLVLDVARSVHREVGRALLAKATRDRDGYVATASRVTYANRVRAKLGRPTLLLSLHTASSTDPEDRGIRVARTSETPERTVEPFRDQLSRYCDSLRDGFAIDGVGTHLEGWSRLEVPAISVELGFLTHLDDARRLLDRSLRLELARCLAAAAVEALHTRPGPARELADRPALASLQAALHSGTAG